MTPATGSVPRQFVLYGLVSGVALFVDAGLLKLLSSLLGWHYLLAASISFLAGAVVAYALSVRYVFPSGRLAGTLYELPVFVALGVIGLLINAAVIKLGVEAFKWSPLQAKIPAAGCTFVANFLCRRAILFSRAY